MGHLASLVLNPPKHPLSYPFQEQPLVGVAPKLLFTQSFPLPLHPTRKALY